MFKNKRKIDSEHRVFREQWENDYFFIEWQNKGMCLICQETISVLKEANIKRHYKVKHGEKCKDLVGAERAEQWDLLKRNLNIQQDVCSFRASYFVAQSIAKESKSFSDGEFVKKCMSRVINEICPEKKYLFEQICLSSPTIAERIEELGLNLFKQLEDRAKHFLYYSIALDERSCMTNTSQLPIFIRGVNYNFEITEELAGLVTLNSTTTREDIFTGLSNTLNNLGLSFGNLVSVTTNGGKRMIDSDIGLIGIINAKMSKLDLSPPIGVHCIIDQQVLLSEKCFLFQIVMSNVVETINFLRSQALDHRQFRNIFLEIESEYIDDLHHSNLPWLNKGTILKQFFFLHDEIKNFLRKNNNVQVNTPRCVDIWSLALLTDITHHLNLLSLKLQGKEKLVSNLFGTIKAFQHKLSLFMNQMEKSDLSHFECCAILIKEDYDSFPKQLCVGIIRTLKIEFQERFKDILANEKLINLFENPFNIDPENIETYLQLEIIELQCNNYLKRQFENYSNSGNLVEFYSNLSKDNFPNVRQFAAKISCMFCSTYICEQVFSSMKINGSKTQSRITNEHFHALLRVYSSKLEPDIDVLCQQKQGQQSH